MTAFSALTELMRAARASTELYRDHYLDKLPFQTISPPLSPVRTNTQWGLGAMFGVPDKWQDASLEHLAQVTTQIGIPMEAGVIEPGEGVIMAGAANITKESGPEGVPANFKMYIFKQFAQRREQALGSKVAQQNLFRVGGEGALTLWFSGFPGGDNHAEVWGVRGGSVFLVIGEGPIQSQAHWGQVLYTVLGTWTWL